MGVGEIRVDNALTHRGLVDAHESTPSHTTLRRRQLLGYRDPRFAAEDVLAIVQVLERRAGVTVRAAIQPDAGQA